LRLTLFDRVTFLLFNIRCSGTVTAFRAVSLKASLKFRIYFKNADLKLGVPFALFVGDFTLGHLQLFHRLFQRLDALIEV
jgi:hypothetical protein